MTNAILYNTEQTFAPWLRRRVCQHTIPIVVHVVLCIYERSVIANPIVYNLQIIAISAYVYVCTKVRFGVLVPQVCDMIIITEMAQMDNSPILFVVRTLVRSANVVRLVNCNLTSPMAPRQA